MDTLTMDHMKNANNAIILGFIFYFFNIIIVKLVETAMLQLIVLLAHLVIKEFMLIIGNVMTILAVLAYVQVFIMTMGVKCVLIVIIHGLFGKYFYYILVIIAMELLKINVLDALVVIADHQ